MNTAKRLQACINKLTETYIELQELRDEMSIIFDERSDSWKESDRGVEFEERISVLDEAAIGVENAANELEDL